MAIVQSLEDFKNELHISYSQIFTFLSCSAKYLFQYVEHRPYERTSINLFLGSALHTAIARTLRTLKEQQVLEPFALISELFEDSISTKLDHNEIPLIYKKEAPDKEATIRLGNALLKAWYENIDLNGNEIVEVEMPLSANLYNGEKMDSGLKLIGIIDLLLLDENNELIVVDHKSAARAKSQSNVDNDLQFSAYSYLLAANKLTPFSKSDVKCRLDVMRKLKTPKIERYHTVRTAADRKRFAKIANKVLIGIENKVFIPNKSWLCNDCQFTRACDSY